MSNKFYIYKIYQPEIPEIFYIGSTINFSQRKSNHKKNCNNKVSKKYKYPIYKYIRECGGWDKFIMEIYEEHSYNNKNDILSKEQEVIDLLKPQLNTIKSSLKL